MRHPVLVDVFISLIVFQTTVVLLLQPQQAQNLAERVHLATFFVVAGACTCSSKCAYRFSFPALTYLEIDSCHNINLDEETTPNILALTALQKLRVCGINYFDPRLLESYKAIQHLDLQLTLYEDGTEALLTDLPKLQKLRFFTLKFEQPFVNAVEWEAGPAAFSAFTASSHLEAIHLTGMSFPDATAWQHMFAQGRKLRLLRELTLKRSSSGR